MDLLLRLRLLLPSAGQVWGIFVFHDAFGPEFVLMHYFPSRQEADCVSWWWTQPGLEGCLGALTHRTGRNSFFRNQMFWFSSCNIFSFQIVTAAAATWSFRWKLLLYLWPSHKLTKPVQYPQCIGKVRSISNPFSPNKMWSDPPTPKKNRKLLHYQICVIQVWLWVLILLSAKRILVFYCISWFQRLTRKRWLLGTF